MPFIAAKCKGVLPSASAISGLAPNLINSCKISDYLLCLEAISNGVLFLLSTSLGSAFAIKSLSQTE
jgi:hypothetical protein